MFTLELEGLEELKRDWKHLETYIGSRLRPNVDKACKDGAAEARSTHRYKDRTGNLTDKTVGRVTTATFGSCDGEIIAGTPYAKYVSDGTPEHKIPAKNGKWLAWDGPGGQGDTWFAKVVTHPGTKPDPFMGNAYLKAERVLIREIEITLDTGARIFET